MNSVPARDRSRAPDEACLVGSPLGTKSGYYLLRNQFYDTYITSSSGSGAVFGSHAVSDAARWELVDNNLDGWFGLRSKSFGNVIQGNVGGADATTSTATLTDHRRQWQLRDADQDGFFGLINRSLDPEHLDADSPTGNLDLDGDPYNETERWTICPG